MSSSPAGGAAARRVASQPPGQGRAVVLEEVTSHLIHNHQDHQLGRFLLRLESPRAYGRQRTGTRHDHPQTNQSQGPRKIDRRIPSRMAAFPPVDRTLIPGLHFLGPNRRLL